MITEITETLTLQRKNVNPKETERKEFKEQNWCVYEDDYLESSYFLFRDIVRGSERTAKTELFEEQSDNVFVHA